MGITTIFLYFFYSIILFLILEYFYNKNINKVNIIAITLIYIIIISGITPNNTDNIFLVVVIELLLRIFYTNYVLEKNIFKSDLINIKQYIITIIISYFLNITFINKIDTVFPTPEDIRLIIWIMIIIFIYIILKDNLNLDKLLYKNNNFNDNEDYIVSEYAKMKNKYSTNITPKNKNIIPLIYAIMIYKNYYKPNFIRKIDLIKFKIDNEERTMGIMQVKSKKIITDEESISIAIKDLDKITNNLTVKKYKQSTLIKNIIKQYIKDDNSEKEIIDIYNIILNFDKK